MVNWLHKYRNMLLLTLLLVTMAVSYMANQRQMAEEASTVTIPVQEVAAPELTPLEQYRQERDAAALRDMAALEALCAQEKLDEQTRSDAAAQLQRLIDTRQKQTALEGALSSSGIAPCAAVVAQGSVTIVTEKATLTEGERALLLTMAQSHAGVEPSGVRVITADAK
ncbi:MAG: SpoIIIAH-like family protein [Aristaeellaceae bacterium]